MNPEMISYLVELWAYDKLRAKIMSLITKSDIFVASGFIRAGNTFLFQKGEIKMAVVYTRVKRTTHVRNKKVFHFCHFLFVGEEC